MDVTTAPDASCDDIVDPVRITSTEGLRRGTRQAGAPVRVRVLPPGTPG